MIIRYIPTKIPLPHTIFITMQMSMLRPEDYVCPSTTINHYWAQLLRTVDEFDQLMELQKREIANCVKEFNLKRTELVRHFSYFKDSMRFEGEVPKREVIFVQTAQYSSIFKGYHHAIIDIIQRVILQPRVLAELLNNFVDIKRLKFQDFLQNIVFNIYPYYLPTSGNAPLFVFFRELLQKWTYSAQLTRPTHYTLIDQALGGLMKAPSIVCYVQKIVSYFLHQSAQCNMSVFAFDDEAQQKLLQRISNQLKLKKQAIATFSHNNQKPASWKDKFKGFFRKEKDDSHLTDSRFSFQSSNTAEDSFLDNKSIQSQGNNVIEISRSRQAPFFKLIGKVAQFILDQQIPLYLCRMLACFDQKLDKICANLSQSRKKHYCYFLMTNLVLSELHNKYTINFQETGMKHAELQNISEIIKFLNAIFQGLLPESDKYRLNIAQQFSGFCSKVQAFYSNALLRGRMQHSEQGQLLDILLSHYENSVVMSLHDLALIVAMLRKTKPSSYVLQPHKLIQFLEGKQAQQLLDIECNKGRQFKYKGGSHSLEHVFLVHQSRKPSIKEVIDYYLTVDQPLADIPLIREIFLTQSNLQISQTLEIQQDLKLIQKLPIKQLRGFLGKIASKFKELRVRDGRQLQSKFQQSFKSTLTRSLRRKQWLLYYKSELSQRLSSETALMNYFTGQLNSVQFYERMARSFCESVRFKIYLNIENNIFKVHKTPQQLKKIQISTLMVAKDDSKSNSSNENYILRNSFKVFQTYKELIRCIAKNEITMMALAKGRQADEFNVVFQQIANTIVIQISQFINKKHFLQVLSEQKLSLIVVKSMQDQILKKFRQQKLANEKDKQLYISTLKIDKNLFWKKDLEEYGLDRQFIASQGSEKFKMMIEQKNVWLRLKHFSQFFKIIFTILGFTMAKNKISAEIVTPLVQYIILECATLKHHQCLFSIQSLRWRQTPEDIYHLTLYQSSLTYIRQLMPKDYPLH